MKKKRTKGRKRESKTVKRDGGRKVRINVYGRKLKK